MVVSYEIGDMSYELLLRNELLTKKKAQRVGVILREERPKYPMELTAIQLIPQKPRPACKT